MCLTRLQELYLIYVQFRRLDRMIQVFVAFFNSVIPKHNRGKYFYWIWWILNSTFPSFILALVYIDPYILCPHWNKSFINIALIAPSPRGGNTLCLTFLCVNSCPVLFHLEFCVCRHYVIHIWARKWLKYACSAITLPSIWVAIFHGRRERLSLR